MARRGRGRSVYLYEWLIEEAREIGDGSISKGIRIALDEFSSDYGDEEFDKAQPRRTVLAILSDDDVARAKQIGQGNISRGVRIAIRDCP